MLTAAAAFKRDYPHTTLRQGLVCDGQANWVAKPQCTTHTVGGTPGQPYRRTL